MKHYAWQRKFFCFRLHSSQNIFICAALIINFTENDRNFFLFFIIHSDSSLKNLPLLNLCRVSSLEQTPKIPPPVHSFPFLACQFQHSSTLCLCLSLLQHTTLSLITKLFTLSYPGSDSAQSRDHHNQ